LGKYIAAGISIIYLLLAGIYGGGAVFIRMFLFLLLPMACIWFSDEMGGVTGVRMRMIGPRITQPSPGCMVKFMGWVLLLLPIIWVIIFIKNS